MVGVRFVLKAPMYMVPRFLASDLPLAGSITGSGACCFWGTGSGIVGKVILGALNRFLMSLSGFHLIPSLSLNQDILVPFVFKKPADEPDDFLITDVL